MFRSLVYSYRKMTGNNALNKKAWKIPKWVIKVLVIMEMLIVTFIATIIPDLIAFGKIPTCIADIYVPILSSLLVSIYAYMRIRGIEIPDEGD